MIRVCIIYPFAYHSVQSSLILTSAQLSCHLFVKSRARPLIHPPTHSPPHWLINPGVRAPCRCGAFRHPVHSETTISGHGSTKAMNFPFLPSSYGKGELVSPADLAPQACVGLSLTSPLNPLAPKGAELYAGLAQIPLLWLVPWFCSLLERHLWSPATPAVTES